MFITTQPERGRWLGTILGKFLPPGRLWDLNAALLLKHNNRFYSESSRMHYFDLSQSAGHWAPRLCDLQPNVLIGPPSVLAPLADSAALHVEPQNLYQAKEGFLAAGCRHGALHWNEDLMGLEVMRFKGRPWAPFAPAARPSRK